MAHQATVEPQAVNPVPRARLLIVDDIPAVADFMALVLREAGYCVDVAPGGPEALARLDEQDAVISDLWMPRMSGSEFYRHAVAEHPALSHRFIFVTGDPNDQPQAVVDSGCETLPKPFRPAMLLAAVEKTLARQ